tara:strand:+ start:15221 stop:16396 length:1176 start_codon:yes stop_codon:yes gene_type:complete
MMGKILHTDLPDNLTFDRSRSIYRYRNPLTKKWAWSCKDKTQAIEKAIKSNEIIALRREQQHIANGNDSSLRYVIRLYKELVLPSKAWSPGTRTNKLAKINKLDALYGHHTMAALDQIFIGDHLNGIGRNGDTYNKWREVWIDLCALALSRKLVDYNAAEATLTRSTSKKLAVNRRRRVNLTLDHFNAIYNHGSCPDFLKLAMDFSLLTLQSRTELVNLQFDQFKDDGYLYFIRQKTAGDTDMSFIRFEINEQLAALKVRSQKLMMKAGYRSPYLIHRIPERKSFGKHNLKRLKHFGVIDAFLTKTFAYVRDQARCFEDLPDHEEPATFHSIRGLGGQLLAAQGWTQDEIQPLMTHASKRTTKIYLDKGINALTPNDYIKVKTGLNLDTLR